MNQQHTLSVLFQKYLDNTCSSEELNTLLHLLEDKKNSEIVTAIIHEQLNDQLDGKGYTNDALRTQLEKRLELILQQTDERTSGHNKSRSRLFNLRGLQIAAAMVTLLLGVGAYLWWNTKQKPHAASTASVESIKKIVPGTSKATLTLADGNIITLDASANGTLTQQQGITVQNKNGQLEYTVASAVQPGKNGMQYNTLRTPRGGQYQVVLPDGSKVWLNAASSLHFPTYFEGKERRVEITGEAYLEVAQNATQPFYVTANGVTVQVLGTSFNVNAYDDEPYINTTLINGSIKVTNGKKSVLVKPGQQALATTDGAIKLQNSNGDETAWTQNLFKMKNASIASIMRQLARWYDVSVQYENGVPDGTISGEVPRSMNLEQVLKIYEYSGVHFAIKGNTIIVKQ